MSIPCALLVARMHGHLACRPGSPVFHIYSGPLTPPGRWVPRAGRAVCTANTRRLSILGRAGAAVDLGGRRMCGRCTARLTSLSARAVQPVTRADRLAVYGGKDGVTLGDLAVAVALATSVDETHAIGTVAALVHGPMSPTTVRRPAEVGYRQARYDLEVELLRRRRDLTAAARTPEEIEDAALAREAAAARDAQILAARKKTDARDRAVDRRNRGRYLTPWERELANTA